jgi:hypothetical protein
MQTTDMKQGEQLVGGSLWWGAMLAIGIASIANAAIFALAAVSGLALRASLAPGRPPQPLQLGLIVFATVVPTLLPAGLLGLLGRVTDRPVRLFQWIAVVVFVLSLTGPLSQTAGATATVILIIMHVIAASVIVGVLSLVRRRASGRSRPR